jgi:hypothetical protein
MFCNAVLLTLENFEAVVISTGGRISNKLRETCRMLLNNVPGANERVFISGEHMYYRSESALGVTGRNIKWSKLVSKLSTYPSDADSEQHRSHRHHHHRRIHSCFQIE